MERRARIPLTLAVAYVIRGEDTGENCESTAGKMGEGPSEEISVKEFKVGDRVTVKLSGGRLLDAEIKAIIDTTAGVRLQVSFGEETARIYVWQVVEKSR
jgi:hypothetical protein